MSAQLALDVIDVDRLPELFIGMSFDAAAIGSLAVLTFRRSRSRAIFVFTLVVINMVVFFVTYLMSIASVSTNVGFGLFALFGILRFRTGTLPVMEMTYLFAGIALAAFNALALTSLTLTEAIIANVVVIGVLELLGGAWMGRQDESHQIVYERVELLHPSRRSELVADLEQRTGFSVIDVVVHDINFLNDTAQLTIRTRAAKVGDAIVHAEIGRAEW